MTTGLGDDPDDDHRAVHLLQETSSPSENWDDDFEFQPAATDHDRDGEYDATNAPRPASHSHEQEESWDDAYEDEDPDTSPIKRAPKVEEEDVEDWDSSDNEAHDERKPKREHHVQYDQEREFGAGGFEEEDKTVTARSSSSRVRARDVHPALPVPSLPSHAHHPNHPPPSFSFNAIPQTYPVPSTSPTLSSFSIPISSNRGSMYSQDPLMPTASNSSAPHLSSLSAMRSYPQAAGSTPPRKGRRLRKKSRPPEADIFELEDREPDPISLPALIPERERPSTPPPRSDSPFRPSTPPPTNTPAESRASQPTPSPSLLTRIGSLKRWARRSVGPDDPAVTGWRRGKSSTGPSETGRMGKSSTGPEELTLAEEPTEEDLRTVSPTPAPGSSKKAKARRSRGESTSGQKAGWFFRVGGGGSERDETSGPASVPAPVDAAMHTPEPSPSKRSSGLGLRRKDKDKEHEREGETPTPKKRIKGKLIPALKTNGSGFQAPSQPASPTTIPRDELQVRQGSRPVSMLQQSQPSQPMLFPLHGSASVGRTAGAPLSVSIADPAIPQFSADEGKLDSDGKGKESGMRSLMNGVRRLSLVSGGGHKRTKSTGGDVGAVEVARKERKSDGAGRPRSRAEDRPRSNAENPAATRTSGLGARPGSRASARGTQRGGEKDAQALLPPVELDSPLSAQYARRGSLPWADHDPTTGSSIGFSPATGGSSPDYPRADSSDSHSRLTLNLLPIQQPHMTTSPSFSASATSLLTGSPTRLAPPPTGALPVPVPIQPQSFGTLPRSRVTPSTAHSAQAPQVPASPTPLSASLGRSTASPSHSGLRRNSLGDLKLQTPSLGELKIPARISRAQHGLKRDMGMVREFARSVEQLKRLQATYATLLSDLRSAYDTSPASPASRSASPAPMKFHLPSRPQSQAGTTKTAITTNPNPSLQSVHQLVSPHPVTRSSRPSRDISRELIRLEHEYGIWWECAELLVELGGGSESVTASNPNLATHSSSVATTPAGEPLKELSSVDEPSRATGSGLHLTSMSEPGSIFEHALPEASKGPPQASPPHPSQWRASTGRHDLSARQLRLLKDMLSTPDPATLADAAGPYGYGVGYPYPQPYSYTVEGEEDSQPWAAWNPSAITLPSEESSADPHMPGVPYGNLTGASVGRSEGKEKKRRASRLGMLGLRDLLRGLKRNAVAEGRLGAGYTHGHQGSESSTSNSAEDDHYNRRHSPWHQHDANHAAKLSTSPDEVAVVLDQPSTRKVIPKSPRRPSLASIFRLGQKGSKNTNGRSKDPSTSGTGNSTTEDERETGLGGGPAGDYSDWERMSRSDLDLNAATIGSGMTTVRGKKKAQLSGSNSNTNLPYAQATLPDSTVNISTPKKTPATSQTSLRDSSPLAGTPPHPSRLPLSIAEEDGGLHAPQSKAPTRPKKERTPSWSQANPGRPGSRNGRPAMTGTVRSAPPTDLSSSDPKLALTPENIKPLLEYAREVSTRLGECIGEVQTLLSAKAL